MVRPIMPSKVERLYTSHWIAGDNLCWSMAAMLKDIDCRQSSKSTRMNPRLSSILREIYEDPVSRYHPCLVRLHLPTSTALIGRLSFIFSSPHNVATYSTLRPYYCPSWLHIYYHPSATDSVHLGHAVFTIDRLHALLQQLRQSTGYVLLYHQIVFLQYCDIMSGHG